MRVIFDDAGYVKSWCLVDDGCFFEDESELVIPTEKDLDIAKFYDEYHLYHLVNNKLVKDEARQAELEAARAKAEKAQEQTLSLQEKLALFVDTLEVDAKPAENDNVEFVPYFDKNAMKFTWKEVSKANN